MRKQYYTEDQIRKFLQSRINFSKSRTELANELGLSKSGVTEVLNGKLGISENFAAKLGFKRVVLFVKSKCPNKI